MPHERRGLGREQRHLPVPAQWALVAGFCLLLALPAVLTGRGGGSENPQAVPRPALSWSQLRSFPRQFDGWFSGRFGLRRPLVRLHNWLRVFVLRTSPMPRVVLGSAGWLYYDGDPVADGTSFSDFRGGALYPPDMPDRIADKVAGQAAWLAARGIRYAVVICPNKETIYPEHVPASAGPRGRRTRFDQVAEALARRGLPVVDPRAALRDAKEFAPVYYKLDTHWTPFGALVAYRQLIERLREAEPRLAPVRLEEYRVQALPHTGRIGDIPFLLSLPGLFDEWEAAVEPGEQSWPAEGKLGKVVLFRDSFGESLAPRLQRHFREVIDIPGPIDFKTIEERRPDVVIFEVVERYLTTLQNSALPPAAARPGPAAAADVSPAAGRAREPGRAGPVPRRRGGAEPRG